MVADLRQSFRYLLRHPGFSGTALLLLVLGIGSNTAVFTLIKGAFLNPFPGVGDASSLAMVYAATLTPSGERQGHKSTSYPNLRDLRQRSREFSDIAAFQWWPMSLTGTERAERVAAKYVTANYFSVLGVTPARGRFFDSDGDEAAEVAEVVVSDGCWHRCFGGDPEVVGRSVMVNGLPLTVVGVAPPRFHGVRVDQSIDLWVPIGLFEQLFAYPEFFHRRDTSFWLGIGRLRPGGDHESADRELAQLAGQLVEEYPEENDQLALRASPLIENTVLARERGRYLGYGKTLVGGAALILVIACLNVGFLLLVRGARRHQEMAVRQALGADRKSLLRALLADSLLLFVIGGLLSIPVGRWCLDLLWRFRPPEFDGGALNLGIDLPVLAFALTITLGCALVFGLLPAVRTLHRDLVSPLRAADTGGSGRMRWWSSGNLLVATQVALALVSLVGASLFLQSLAATRRIDLGYSYERTAVVTLAPQEAGYGEAETRQLFERLLERVRQLPEVEGATLAENRLLRGAVRFFPVYLDDRADEEQISGNSQHRTSVVVPGFFSTVDIPLLAGRDFAASDCADCAPVAIINRTMAERVWPGTSAVGKQFYFFRDQDPLTVVGVVEDARYRYLHSDPEFFIYRPATQDPVPTMTLHAVARGDPLQTLASLRRVIGEEAPGLPLVEASPLREHVDNAMWMERTSSLFWSAYGLLALALATVGVYGVIAYTVTQRRREFGIRLALGADRRQVVGRILARTAAVTAAGLAIGWLLGYAVLRPLIAEQLYQVEAGDPLTYLVVSALLMAVALAGSYLPARRAAAVPPALPMRNA